MLRRSAAALLAVLVITVGAIPVSGASSRATAALSRIVLSRGNQSGTYYYYYLKTVNDRELAVTTGNYDPDDIAFVPSNLVSFLMSLGATDDKYGVYAEYTEQRGRYGLRCETSFPVTDNSVNLMGSTVESGSFDVSVPATIPAKVTTISHLSQYYATSLVLDPGITTIEPSALGDNWANLTDIWLPDTISSIGTAAFDAAAAKKLNTIHYAGNETDWQKIAGHQNVPSNVGVQYNQTDPPGPNIPSSGPDSFRVTRVLGEALAEGQSASAIRFEEGISEIQPGAIGEYPALTEISIPASVSVVGCLFDRDTEWGKIDSTWTSPNVSGVTTIVYDGTVQSWYQECTTAASPVFPDLPSEENLILRTSQDLSVQLTLEKASTARAADETYQYYLANVPADAGSTMEWTVDEGSVTESSTICAGSQKGSIVFTPPSTTVDKTVTLTGTFQDGAGSSSSVTAAIDVPANSTAPEATPISSPASTPEPTPEPTPDATPPPSSEPSSVTIPPLPQVTFAPLVPTPSPTPGAASTPTATPTPSVSSTSSPSSNPVPTASVTPGPVQLREDAPDLPPSLQVIENPDGTGGSILRGGEIGTLWDATTVEKLTTWINDPEKGTVRVLDMNGRIVPSDRQIATGMIVQVLSSDGTVVQESTIVVEGDVLGTGEMGLTQLVRMAAAFTDQDPLEGPYAEAADLDGQPGVSLTDIVKLAQKFREGSVDVEYEVADKDSGEVLEEAGYDLAPWTDELAVFKVDIPENAKIENIAWTQHDIFPDGREQKLYYEGPEESLIFGTYTEGRTIVTTVVTTETGKTGSRQTEVMWDSGGGSAESSVVSDTIPYEEGLLAARQANVVSEDGFSASGEPVSGVRPARPTRTPGARPTRTAEPTQTSNAAPSAQPTVAMTVSPAASGAPQSSQTAQPTRSPHPTRPARPTAVSTASMSPPEASQMQGLMLPTFRAEAFNACNDLRDLNRIRPALKTSTKLGEAAMVRAEEMAANKELNHTRPDGSGYQTVVTLGHGTVIGENIHSNRGYPVPDIARVAARGWTNSAPHRKQMLEPRYSYTGLGFALADNGTWYCVQVFSNGDDVITIDAPKA